MKLFFESERIEHEWPQCVHLLQDIVRDTADEFPARLDHVRVTSIYRTEEENAAVGGKTTIHCQIPHRAVDLGGAELTQNEIDSICSIINAKYIYDPQRPEKVVAYGMLHGTGRHIHCQVHENTELR